VKLVYSIITEKHAESKLCAHSSIFISSCFCYLHLKSYMSGQAKAKVMESSSTDAKGMQLQFSCTREFD